MLEPRVRQLYVIAVRAKEWVGKGLTLCFLSLFHQAKEAYRSYERVRKARLEAVRIDEIPKRSIQVGYFRVMWLYRIISAYVPSLVYMLYILGPTFIIAHVYVVKRQKTIGRGTRHSLKLVIFPPYRPFPVNFVDLLAFCPVSSWLDPCYRPESIPTRPYNEVADKSRSRDEDRQDGGLTTAYEASLCGWPTAPSDR